MATYKVIQDIEAEDKLIGWMTPRQAIYATIVILSGALIFLFATRGVWWLGIPLLPHMILFTVLAGPFVHDQPSEIWLLAKIRFGLVPRRRIWNQSGVSDLVTITAPKKIEKVLTDGLSQTEVKSRLKALATTIDSRGWAVKNVNVNLYSQAGYIQQNDDRLIGSNALPQEVPNYDVLAQDDILDERSNPIAKNLDQMITQSTNQHREQLVAMMQQKNQTVAAQAPTDQHWFNEPSSSEAEALATLQARRQQTDPAKARMRTISPTGKKSVVPSAPAQPVTTPEPMKPIDRVNEQLSQDNNSMIDKLARDAKRLKEGDDEVVISLH